MMERLTRKSKSINSYVLKDPSAIGCMNAVDKLGDYEDIEEHIGIPLKNLAEICNNKIPEECRNPNKAIVLTDEDVDRWNGYRDLEDRLHGISIKQVVDGFIKTVENQTHEGYENGRILTNEDADRWSEYKSAEEQGLLLLLPCKVGDTVYSIANDGKIYPAKATREVRIMNGVLHIICESCKYADLVSCDDIGKTVFLTQSEAEKKLKEMESDWYYDD